MAIKFPPRSFLTFPEVQARWGCTENDLIDQVVRGRLKPSIKPSEPLSIPDWEFDKLSETLIPAGPAMVGTRSRGSYEDDGEELVGVHPAGWIYLQSPRHIGPLDCEFNLASDDRDPEIPEQDGIDWSGGWYFLPSAITMDDVKANAVFLMTEIVEFERSNGDAASQPANRKSADSLREKTLLKLVITMAIKGYCHDPAASKSTAPKEIADDAALLEMSVSDDTVRQYLKQAADTVLPAKPRQS